MNKKFSSGLAIILPNKKINLFVFCVIMLGILTGTIFLIAINETDKEQVINQIINFINNVNDNNINNFAAFKNAFIENIIFILVVWIFGMSIIGIVFNIFIMYLKGFILGFTLSSFFLLYKFKGLLLGIIYLVPSMIINFLVTLILGVYSIMLTIYLWKVIFMKDRGNNIKIFLKKYFIILIISIILIVISSLCEGYLVPALIKLFIKLFI
jgi:stage II sporulation protein M